MVKLALEIHTTYFIVRVIDPKVEYIIKIITANMTTYTHVYDHVTKKNIKAKDKSYFTHISYLNEYRFAVSILKDFLLTAGKSGLTRENLSIQYNKNFNVDKLNLQYDKKFKPRAYQKRYIDAIFDSKTPDNLLIDLATGYGKTAIAMNAIVRANMKTCILVLPKYINKWIDDVKKYTNVSDVDIYIVRGADSLIKLMTTDTNSYKFIIFSMRTMINYIKAYENHEDEIYPVKPDQLMQYLKSGFLLNDESHQEMHALFKIMLYLDTIKFVGLSATFDTNQEDIKYMQRVLFPVKNRLSGLVEYVKYINVNAVQYKLESAKGLVFKGPQGYNHNLFEQSIMRNSVLMRGYIQMIMQYVKTEYYERRVAGNKLLIFAASIRLCTILTNYIQKAYSELDVRRYVMDDPYENILNADITISTIGSSGTALDIPNLITVINTTSMSSLQANIQALGRLREITGIETRYIYFYTKDIINQLKMHFDRKNSTKHMANTYIHTEYNKLLKTR